MSPIRLTLRLPGLLTFAKAAKDMPNLFGDAATRRGRTLDERRAHLHAEVRSDRDGTKRTRWIRNPDPQPAAAPAPMPDLFTAPPAPAPTEAPAMPYTPTQMALLTAISDYQLHRSDPVNLRTLATHPALKALGLNEQGLEAELKAAPSGLFMTKPSPNFGGARSWTLAHKGLDVTRAEKFTSSFFAPAPPKPKPAAPAPTTTPEVVAVPTKLGYQDGDARSLTLLNHAPPVGTVRKEGEVYVA